MGKPGGRRPLDRPRRRLEDNIKVDLQEVGGGLDWIDVAQERADGGLFKCSKEISVSTKC